MRSIFTREPQQHPEVLCTRTSSFLHKNPRKLKNCLLLRMFYYEQNLRQTDSHPHLPHFRLCLISPAVVDPTQRPQHAVILAKKAHITGSWVRVNRRRERKSNIDYILASTTRYETFTVKRTAWSNTGDSNQQRHEFRKKH